VPTSLDSQSILSAMITPAVLISACGSLIMATSGRLNRAVDRTRETSQRFAQLPSVAPDVEGRDGPDDEERRMLFVQLDVNTTRARYLQRALARLYWALGTFVGTSVAIGIVAVAGGEYAIAPVVLGLSGAGLLLWASILLVHESRLALTGLEAEMDYLWQHAQRRADPAMLGLTRPTVRSFFARR
jgi:hypothetical protein